MQNAFAMGVIIIRLHEYISKSHEFMAISGSINSMLSSSYFFMTKVNHDLRLCVLYYGGMKCDTIP